MEDYSALNAVIHATNSDPIEFENEIVRGLSTKIQDAIEKKREEIAYYTFGGTPPEETETEVPAEVDPEANVEVPADGENVDPVPDEEEELNPGEE